MQTVFLVLASVAVGMAIAAASYALLWRSQNIIERIYRVSTWFEHRWPRIHTLAAPYGIAFTTLLLAVYLDEGAWKFWQSWAVIKDTASVAAIIYALIAISTEVLVTMVFFALGQLHKIIDQNRKVIEQNRKAREAVLEAQWEEGLEAGREEGLEAGREEGREAGREEGRAEVRKDWQEWYDHQIASGIQMPEPPPFTRGGGP